MSSGGPVLFGLLLGVASAAHCAGMCGVFALRTAMGRRTLPCFLAYGAGKAFTYVFLGAIAGWLGARVLGRAAWVQGALGAAVAVGLLAAGVRLVLPVGAPSRLGASLAAFLAPLLRSLPRGDTPGAAFSLGAVTGALPCGVVYLGVLEAAARGSPLLGAVVMAALGAGTLPVLGGLSLAGRRLLPRARHWRIAGGGLLVGLAALTAVRALGPFLGGGDMGASPCCR